MASILLTIPEFGPDGATIYGALIFRSEGVVRAAISMNNRALHHEAVGDLGFGEWLLFGDGWGMVST